MQIDTVVFFRIYDSQLFTYGAVNPIGALENLTATTLRNIVGELELDQLLTSRDSINQKLQVDAPILETVYRVLYTRTNPAAEMQRLAETFR